MNRKQTLAPSGSALLVPSSRSFVFAGRPPVSASARVLSLRLEPCGVRPPGGELDNAFLPERRGPVKVQSQGMLKSIFSTRLRLRVTDSEQVASGLGATGGTV